ncbi:uncharacterized protein LOC142489273 isoform X1 [Ascaphus truei]|uniref:uncharacterized protein LOC142489273 isoform X1 n=1 Tax=Ascaphus truei TaxID=8439 RepID=UPI003F591D9F
MAAVEEKQEDQENRTRRNNLRFKNITETVTDLERATTEWLQTLLPETPPALLILDRVHRALRPRPQAGDRARDVVVRMHYFKTKEAISNLAREKGGLKWGDVKIDVYNDLAPSTLLKRMALRHITKVLRDNEIRYKWGFPFCLIATRNGTQAYMRDPEEGVDFLERLGLQPPDSMSSEEHRPPPVRPIWKEVGRGATPHRRNPKEPQKS